MKNRFKSDILMVGGPVKDKLTGHYLTKEEMIVMLNKYEDRLSTDVAKHTGEIAGVEAYYLKLIKEGKYYEY